MNYFLKNKKIKNYFAVKIIYLTGCRISELIKVKYEHIYAGQVDIISKGQKLRKLIFPLNLINEFKFYFKNMEGYIFVNKKNKIVNIRYLYEMITNVPINLINLKVLYPHSLRHRFAKNFINNKGSVFLLADILGHSNIQTTRIYLKSSLQEKIKEINQIVNW